MSTLDPRIDKYIAGSADFAQPILNHLRRLIQVNCPDVKETIKWGFPVFEYSGEIMCNMASFKEHCAFGFWKASLLNNSKGILKASGTSGMGDVGKIKSISDLPDDKVLIDFIKQAMLLNENKIKVSKKPKADSIELEIPDYFIKLLNKNKKAKATFDGFSRSNKNEYLEWILEAKTEITRDKRMATAIEWMAEGKIRNWKYVK